MAKVVRSRFQKCLVPITMLLLDGSSETELFRHFLATFFESVISEITQVSGTSFFEKASSLIYIKLQKKIENIFFASQIIASELAVFNCLY